jgi:amino acid adenylation domain-containing protein
MLAYESLSTPELAGAEVSQRILASGTAVADLSLFVQERADSVEIGLEYRGAVIGRADAERVLDAFESVLVEGLRDSDQHVAELLASHLGHDLHGDHLPDASGTILTRIAEHAQAEPTSIALVADDDEVTYGELAARIAALTTRLSIGGAPTRVGVSLERSTDLVVALLAAQFAGAAYVPLDPTVGAARLERMAEAADLDRLIVRAGGPRFGLPDDRVVELPTTPFGAGHHDGTGLATLAAAIEPDRAAYVIFTSGSTGQPRGVEVTHQNLLASTAARTVWYPDDPNRFLLTSSIGFDSSVVGLFWTLSTGGTLVLPNDDDVHDVDRLGELIHDRQVSHTLMVPSLHRALLSRSADRLGHLSVAIVAGEPCTEAVVTQHVESLPDTMLVNEYGPTEATVWATAHRLDRDHDRVPIGAPVPGVSTRVADASLRPVPDGVVGELLIAGPTVTGGYLDDGAMTAERFVEVDGRRWYRTGDLVRTRNSLIDFVGRVDDQLNVGGMRLEPGEVERELVAWPSIEAAVVVTAGDPPRLAAHVETDDPIDEPALRAALTSALPSGSVPRHLVAWPALPRTPHGKLDRSAVAELPFDDEPGAAWHASAPDTLLDLVVDAWTAALGRRDIGPDADFFDVGGDSLAAVEIVTRLGDHLDRTVPIAALLAAPTPRRLAEALSAADTGAETDPGPARSSDEFQLVVLRPGTVDGPLVVLTPAWDDVFGYQSLAESFDDATAVLALTYHEQPDKPLVTTVEALVTASLDAVRAAVRGRAKVAVLGWSVGGVVAVELAERLHADGERVDLVAAVDTFFPGEHRHLWSNRWWKYKSMLRPGSFGAAGGELRTMAERRVKRLAGKFGRRLLEWSGATLPPEPRRTSVGGFPVDALDHPLTVVHTPMVFFSATTTNPRRTVLHWERVAHHLAVVPVTGRHRGLDSIMAADRVGAITDELSARLGR